MNTATTARQSNRAQVPADQSERPLVPEKGQEYISFITNEIGEPVLRLHYSEEKGGVQAITAGTADKDGRQFDAAFRLFEIVAPGMTAAERNTFRWAFFGIGLAAWYRATQEPDTKESELRSWATRHAIKGKVERDGKITYPTVANIRNTASLHWALDAWPVTDSALAGYVYAVIRQIGAVHMAMEFDRLREAPGKAEVRYETRTEARKAVIMGVTVAKDKEARSATLSGEKDGEGNAPSDNGGNVVPQDLVDAVAPQAESNSGNDKK